MEQNNLNLKVGGECLIDKESYRYMGHYGKEPSRHFFAYQFPQEIFVGVSKVLLIENSNLLIQGNKVMDISGESRDYPLIVSNETLENFFKDKKCQQN